MSYKLTTEKTWDDTMFELSESFSKWGIGSKAWRVTAVRPRSTGRYAMYSASERRVIVEFIHPVGKNMIRVEKSDLSRPQDNLRAIFLSIEAIRMIEKRGTADLVRDALLQIEAPAGERPVVKRDPYEVLEVTRSTSMEVIDAAYKAKARVLHPDAGGTKEEMQELNEAMTAIRNERAATPA